MASSSAVHRLGIVLLPQFSFAGLGALLDALFIVNWLAREQRFRWQLLGSQDNTPASNGVSLSTDSDWPAANSLDSVWVLASFETKALRDDRRLSQWLRQCAAAGVPLAGIEMGSEVLAAAGLLDEQPAAVHWDNLEAFRELYPQVDASSQLYSLTPQRLTCAGGTAVLDLVMAWLQQRIEPALLEELRNHLLERRQRSAEQPQLSHAPERQLQTSAQVRRIIHLMRRHLETPLSSSALADGVGLSVRQLERRFKHEVGVTPMRYYLWLRMTRAHRLLQQTDMSVAEVASSAGFGSLEHFSRAYRRFFDRAPSEDRLQSGNAPAVMPAQHWPGEM